MQISNVSRTASTNNYALDGAERRAHSPGREVAYGDFAQVSGNALVDAFGRSSSSDVDQLFRREFSAAARDQAQFEALLKTAFGDQYDRAAAEGLRQRALRGDYSWLPEVRYVDGDALGGANGAYDATSETILLNADLRGDRALLSQTFVEEVGHHLDTLLNGTDAAGDEGEVFRRLLLGENLTATALAEIRAEDDHGTIVVDGRTIAVEFWNPFKAASKAVSSAVDAVGDAVSDAVDGVGKAASAAADLAGAAASAAFDAGSAVVSSFAGAVSRFGSGIWETVRDQARETWENLVFAGNALWDMSGGFVGQLFRGDFGGAWESLRDGADDLVFRLPGRVLGDALDASEGLLLSTVELIPFEPVRNVVSDQVTRMTDATRSIATGIYDAAVGVGRNAFELAGNLGYGTSLLLTGNVDGFAEIGKGLLKIPQTAVDATIMVLGKTVSAVQTVAHLEEPGRELTEKEVRDMRAVFGDGIDYEQVRIKEGDAFLFSSNDRPFVHGNTIYLKDDQRPSSLIHEMTHIWQHQNGGTDYISEAIASQWSGGAYDWQRSLPDTPFSQLTPEQQAAFIEEAWVEGAFTRSPPSFPASYTPPSGMSLAELNDYLRVAVNHIHAGTGTP